MLTPCIISCVSRTTFKLFFFVARSKNLGFSRVKEYIFYLEEDNCSDILNFY